MNDINPLQNLRIGLGYDLHPLVSGEGIKLGGILIECDKKSVAHSDGDALLHAICDAMLGAAGLGDLGTHFPDTDNKWRDLDSSKLVKLTSELIHKHAYKLINLDCTIILEKPLVAPYMQPMQQKIACLLDVSADSVNIKATRGEGLDALGRGEAIATHCACLLLRY